MKNIPAENYSNPPFFEQLEALLDKAWNLKASLQIDRWIWYVILEVEGVAK
ncbi:hypothetical protein HRE53_22775 [Acaryochloris sp. 'Moss Beach']|uniref:hypothetical protein n=1 Tax=Acaryochloris sp. 'Moss Beach' TaxID=2740837 RepID=UPI001F47CD49|nr:hypothetical protein [Acaryochloris sp. 'Moss Beach']UJB69179.1 hypothetical protein HRE53_22775 [Acaryochloris sp. 'Moss Beach']